MRGMVTYVYRRSSRGGSPIVGYMVFMEVASHKNIKYFTPTQFVYSSSG